MEFIFWTLFLLAFWCYAGYPAVMVLRARLRPKPLRPAGEIGTPLVSVVLAVRNGSEHLRRRVENLLEQDYPADRLEVLVVCNGCTDGAEALAREIAGERAARVRALVSDPGQGKAGALNLGAGQARGEYLVFADVRQVFAPDAVRRLLEPFADPVVGVVGGRLVIQRAGDPAVEGVRSYWKLETVLRSAESRTGSVVGVSGCIYAMRRELFRPLPENLILDDVLVPMRVALGGQRVLLQESALAFDSPSGTRMLEHRRKVRTLAGNLELMRILPSLLVPGRNPLFIRFLSHKVLRLASPFCFLGMLASAGLLAGPLYQAFFWSGLAFYTLGVVGLFVPIPGRSVPSAFIMIHLAVFSALLRFREEAGTLWAPASLEPARATVPARTPGVGADR